MRSIEKYIIALYFFICPLEIALNIIFGSTAKYVGLLVLVVWSIRYIAHNGKTVMACHVRNIILNVGKL